MSLDRSLQDIRIAIVGSGLVGAALAIELGRRGAKIDVFEKRPDLRCSDIPGGRSVVMSLSDRGWLCLDRLGVAKDLRPNTVPKVSRCVHTIDGRTYLQAYGAEGNAIWTIDRKELNCRLMDAAPRNVRFHFQHACLDVEPDGPILLIKDLKRNHVFRQTYDHIIGADGLFSDVRSALSSRRLVKDEMLTLDYGYRELTLPSRVDGDWIFPGDNVHIWPSNDLLLIALPNRNHTFTCSIFYSKKDTHPFAKTENAEALILAFTHHFPEAASMISDLGTELTSHKPSDISAVRCDRWNFEDKVLLIGDAAHAIVPFFAMGMNAGFEDCTVFANMLDKNNGDLKKAIANFGSLRKADTDAIADLSLANFEKIERSWEPDMHRRWQLERLVWSSAPQNWKPLYAMIAFSHIPMSEAMAINDFQQEVLDEIESRLGFGELPNEEQLSEWLPIILADKPDFCRFNRFGGST